MTHEIPDDLRYTPEHEWVQQRQDGVLRVGITAYAQDALGDVVFVTLPQVGTTVAPGQACGEVESTKSVSDVYAPLSGRVTARNDELDARPELVNTDPYGKGWMVEIEPSSGGQPAGLLDAAAYEKLLKDAEG